MENDQNINVQTPTSEVEQTSPVINSTPPPQTPKLSNLTTLQKIVFIVMLAVIITLAGGLIYATMFKESKNNKTSSNVPVVIQKMSCDEAKTTLSDVNSDPNLSQSYNNVTVSSFRDDVIGFTTEGPTYHYFKLTSDSKIEKIGTGNATTGSKDDLKAGLKLIAIQANPLNEIEYVSYRQ